MAKHKLPACDAKEPLSNSFMGRVAVPVAMITRKPAQVVAIATMPSWLTLRPRNRGATLTGQCRLGRPGLTALLSLGMEWPCLAPCMPSRNDIGATMNELFRGSLHTGAVRMREYYAGVVAWREGKKNLLVVASSFHVRCVRMIFSSVLPNVCIIMVSAPT